MTTLISYQINSRGLLDHPFPPGYELIDIPNRRKLVGLYWNGRHRRKDRAKHVWVKRTKRGSLLIAPGVDAEWVPL